MKGDVGQRIAAGVVDGAAVGIVGAGDENTIEVGEGLLQDFGAVAVDDDTVAATGDDKGIWRAILNARDITAGTGV